MIEVIRDFVINVAVMIIFISAVEIVTPENKMKKYVSFVLGLIFIAVLINPIIKISQNSRSGIEEVINNYENEVKKYDKNDSVEVYKSKDDNEVFLKQFEENLSNECIRILKEKFSNMDFKCSCNCECNSHMDINIKNIDVYIVNNNIKTIKKVDINIKETTNNVNDEYKEIIDYLKSELKIDEDKIKVYEIENKEDRENGKAH